MEASLERGEKAQQWGWGLWTAAAVTTSLFPETLQSYHPRFQMMHPKAQGFPHPSSLREGLGWEGSLLTC